MNLNSPPDLQVYVTYTEADISDPEVRQTVNHHHLRARLLSREVLDIMYSVWHYAEYLKQIQYVLRILLEQVPLDLMYRISLSTHTENHQRITVVKSDLDKTESTQREKHQFPGSIHKNYHSHPESL